MNTPTGKSKNAKMKTDELLRLMNGKSFAECFVHPNFDGTSRVFDFFVPPEGLFPGVGLVRIPEKPRSAGGGICREWRRNGVKIAVIKSTQTAVYDAKLFSEFQFFGCRFVSGHDETLSAYLDAAFYMGLPADRLVAARTWLDVQLACVGMG